VKPGAFLAASVTLCLAGLLAPGAASAATIEVTDTTDDYFASPGGTCSLREAVQAANDNADFGGCSRPGSGAADTIVLEGDQTYTRSRAGIDDTNVNGDLDITGPTTIKVEGQGKATIDGNDMDRVIEVRPDARLTGSGLILTNGDVTFGQTEAGGGGILNRGRLVLRFTRVTDNEASSGPTGCPCGGAIYALGGRVNLEKVLLVHNSAQESGGGIAAFDGEVTVLKSTIARNQSQSGAGLAAAVPVTMRGSTVSGNDATGTSVNDGGGGIRAAGDAVILTNSTVSGNEAYVNGGGIYSDDGAIRLNGVTVTANTADADANGTGHGGGIVEETGIENSIVSGNSDLNPTDPAADCFFAQDDPGHNLVGRGTGCDEGGSNIATNRPKLRPLADNGGPTETHALRRKSRAAGHAGQTAPPRDQRGVRRDAHPDIGAFERR
jgi:CSLREA domain-containing protein